MSENDAAAILRAITDFQGTVEKKFDRVFDAIESVCNRVNGLEQERAARDERRRVEQETENRRINWSMVRTLSVVAASGFLALAAMKFLLINMDQWVK